MRRVVVIGKNLLAVRSLEVIMRAGDEVVVAIADSADDGTDGWQPSFRGAALGHNLNVEAPRNVNDPAFVARIDDLEPDFILSFQAPQILRGELIATARVAALNLHFGPLPRYRGVAPIAWAIINGEPATGVTIHHIDRGIDSGAIIRSLAVPISATDTGRSLYDKCTDAGVALFTNAWPTLRSGQVAGIDQSDSEALYYNRYAIDFGARRIAWHWDAKRIADWVRAMIFPPLQYPELLFEGEQYQVVALGWDRKAHRGRPGEILRHEGDLLVVAVPGGRVRLRLERNGKGLDGGRLSAHGFEVGALLDHA